MSENWSVSFQLGHYFFIRDKMMVYDIPDDLCQSERQFNDWVTHFRKEYFWSEEIELQFKLLWQAKDNSER